MNTKIVFSALIIAFSFSGVVFGQESYKTLVFEGNKKFNANDYDGASSKYMEAIQSNSGDFTAHYNLGNALYKRKMYQDAKEEYAKAEKLSQTLPDKAATLHNLGNTMMQLNQPDKAADYYKQSLKQDPYNEATRKNYEIAKLKQKEMERSNGKKDDSPGKNGGGENKNKGEKGDSKNQKQEQGKGPQQNKGEDNKPKEKGGDGKLSKELEKAILDSINGRERKTAKRILDKKSYSKPQSNEKDW
ncbi:tetratricopeptide repeat protein [Chryseobacterium sp. Ch-15]|uniref:Tetratricopeptide repeat protein n=1 Tax=Chryseobacterium muglaense TaxID=2893752 RepID=A0A9Q3UWE1_9FLAO|nr:tetratricopeptide repeat protein [Chryseobacterium muglaense]MBD3905707.1 tetratricopeptide repeat protein [Chryseobacterium muglaense]MCC9034235.1 tetratricopeptide repeat protein [Chryseobacterium muglaense]MCM2555644.1 tetratricopeptide repeat protein [Chryseobacterium muglaense]